MPSLSVAFEAFRRLGARPLFHYAAYQAKLRSGWLKLRTPARSWSGQPAGDPSAAKGGVFPIACDDEHRRSLPDLPEPSRSQAIRIAEGVLGGRFTVFGGTSVDVGFPPAWGAFLPLIPDAPPPIPSDTHWTAYRLDSLGGDVKLVWELSRFGWMYALGRAYALSEDDRFAEGFWDLLGSWREANPPNMGPQWISAQEVALRLMALTAAWSMFAPWLAVNDEKQAVMQEMILVHAGRIPPSLDYALAQDNNHLLVEAAAMLAAGAAFPGMRGAENWLSKGKELLAKGAKRQFFDDGGYVQHSVNYARVALQALLWGSVAAQRAGAPLPPDSVDTLKRGGEWLEAMALGGEGRTPNFGPNDGALILPLTACEYHDVRPTLDAVRRFVGQPALVQGPWTELGDWLGLPRGRVEAPGDASEDKPSAEFKQAGTILMGRGALRSMFRCAHFEGRPGHADQLHLDVWFGGRNLAGDPGTFLYSGKAPWENALAGADVHNQPVVDGLPIMRRAGRFLWLGWAQGALAAHQASLGGEIELALAAHDGYRALGIDVQRTVVHLRQGALLVVDEAFGDGRHRLEVGWNLPDIGWTVDRRAMWLAGGEWTCRLDLPDEPATLAAYKGGEQIVGPETAPHPTWGWISPTYAARQECLRALSSLEGELPLRLVTWFEWDTGTRGEAELSWRPPQAGKAPFSRIRLGEEMVEL